MRKRLLLSAGAIVVLVGAGLLVVAMMQPRPGVTKANFDRIENGMTTSQVEEIFGREGQALRPRFFDNRIGWWADNGSWVTIYFLEDKVNGKSWTELGETFPEKIRRWLHLR